MKINLVIGAGQLGSRHLQGLLKLSDEQTIYVLDPSKESLNLARQRAEEIIHNHNVNFTTDYSTLPLDIDLVIVATNADIREKIVENLLTQFTIKFMLLEKVLFQTLSAYQRIGEILERTETKVWVNHPRRMHSHYKRVKAKLAGYSGSVIVNAVGGNWGLACNAIHFIDLFTYLTDSKLMSIDMELINPEFFNSKRAGFVEFTGTIRGMLENGTLLSITSFPGDIKQVSVTVFGENERFIIQEGGMITVISMCQEDNFGIQVTEYEILYQSSLTTEFAKDIYTTGTCDLPTYNESSAVHQLYIDGLLKKYCTLSGINTQICPIT